MAMQINITDRSSTFKLAEWNDFVCTHDQAYIQKACCTVPDEGGLYFCACGGQDSVVCPAIDCTGIEDFEVDELFERLT